MAAGCVRRQAVGQAAGVGMSPFVHSKCGTGAQLT